MYQFWVVNNEEVCTRKESSELHDKHPKYTVSARPFVSSKLTDGKVCFQLLKDTYFNLITDKNSNIEFFIVAYKCETDEKYNAKQDILNHFNNHVDCSRIKTLFKINESIGDNIHQSNILFSPKINVNQIKEITGGNLTENLMQDILQNINNIKIEFILYPYKNDIYISNPSFEIDMMYLKYLLN